MISVIYIYFVRFLVRFIVPINVALGLVRLRSPLLSFLSSTLFGNTLIVFTNIIFSDYAREKGF